jgi:hypothetical protein
MKTIPLGSPWLGINNRLPPFSLHVDKVGDFLASADNVDIDDHGNIVRRDGASLVQALTAPHSLLKITGSTAGFIVRDSILYAITLPSYSETLVKVLSNDDRVNYAPWGDSWYFSNGTDIGRVTAGVAYPIGLPTPSAPTLSAIGGALTPGRYQVVISYVNTTTGEEGGVSTFATIHLATTGGVRVPLPGATTGATHVNIYLSAANGGAPTLAATVTAATTTHDLTALATGREAAVRREAPLPAGTLFMHDGRLCSFSGSTLYVGLPYRPGYYLPAEGAIPFPDTITIAASVTGGTYIAADRTYFIPEDLGDVQADINDVLPTGAVPGTLFAIPDSTNMGWFGLRGFVIGDAQGNAVEVIRENVDLTPPAAGIAGVRECDGYKRVFSCGWSMNLKTHAVTTYSSYDFTSMSEGYGTKSDGIYRLDDIAPAVDASVGLGKQNFGSEEFKRLPAVYLGVQSVQPMNLRVQAPGGVDYTYSTRGASADLQMQRIDPGKGLRANWFEFTISNTAGADFKLASASFLPIVSTTRRI